MADASSGGLRSRQIIKESSLVEESLDGDLNLKLSYDNQFTASPSTSSSKRKEEDEDRQKATLSAIPGIGASNILVSVMGCFMLMWPIIFVVFVQFTMIYFGGSLKAAALAIQREYNAGNLWEYLYRRTPGIKLEAVVVYFLWNTLQVALYMVVPGKDGLGQPTPSGRVLKYNCNGLNCWIITHILILASVKFGLFRGSILYDNWLSILILANIAGLGLTIFAYVKALKSPSHVEDCRFSGSFFYDLFMGVEHNPRYGDFDFKLFFNGRPGILAWTLINLTCVAKQYERYGYVSNAMVIINLLHAIYILDFFVHEEWYLRTIDIAHDHFGFYLAWGDLVWLPFTYTLQAFYLVQHPDNLSTLQASAILIIGFGGYAIFRLANNQKDQFRKDMAEFGDAIVWGKPATYVAAVYKTHEGQIRHSPLLTSGWWGLARHFNYFGDLLGCLAYSLTCGTHNLLPWFYLIYMTILLTHRVFRDHVRCKEKYGKFWDEYCREVPYKIVPYIF